MVVTRAESGAVTLIGGELIEFSDLQAENARAPLGGPVVTALIDALVQPGKTVLLAGPYEVSVVGQVLDAAGSADLLVRSYPDAESLAERFGSKVRVFAGGLDRFDQQSRGFGNSAYDVVVALDVLRLFGPDSRDLAWEDAVVALGKRVAPDGRLAVGATNRVGLDRLVDARTATMPSRDDEWPRTVPTTQDLRTVRAALSPATEYAVFPDMEHPALAVGVRTLTEERPETLVASAMARGAGDLLADPYRLSREAVASGLGAELAPGWFLITGPAVDLPEVINGELVTGRLVEDVVFDACRRDDELTLRRTIVSYAEWLRQTGTPASADNVVLEGDTLTALDADAGPVDASIDEITVGYLRQLVVRLLASGVRLPWPSGGTPRGLTSLLAGIAGIDLDDELWRRAGGDSVPVPTGYTEALGTISRLSGELADAQGQIRGLEAELRKVRASVALRVGRIVTAPLKAVYRTLGVRWLVRKLR